MMLTHLHTCLFPIYTYNSLCSSLTKSESDLQTTLHFDLWCFVYEAPYSALYTQEEAHVFSIVEI